MTIDEMDAMDGDRCDGCDEAIDDTSRFLITQQVMLPFWSWRLHILATFTNLISRQNVCTTHGQFGTGAAKINAPQIIPRPERKRA